MIGGAVSAIEDSSAGSSDCTVCLVMMLLRLDVRNDDLKD